MNALTLAVVVLGILATACSKDAGPPDLCTPAVKHVIELTLAQSAARSGEVSSDEKAAMGMVMQSSIAQCKRDGLGQAQHDCILAATDWAGFGALGECPAIKAAKPNWLLLPLP